MRNLPGETLSRTSPPPNFFWRWTSQGWEICKSSTAQIPCGKLWSNTRPSNWQVEQRGCDWIVSENRVNFLGSRGREEAWNNQGGLGEAQERAASQDGQLHCGKEEKRGWEKNRGWDKGRQDAYVLRHQPCLAWAFGGGSESDHYGRGGLWLSPLQSSSILMILLQVEKELAWVGNGGGWAPSSCLQAQTFAFILPFRWFILRSYQILISQQNLDKNWK